MIKVSIKYDYYKSMYFTVEKFWYFFKQIYILMNVNLTKNINHFYTFRKYCILRSGCKKLFCE